MEFPLVGLAEVNTSNTAAAAGTEQESLYSRKPVVAGLYVGVLGVAAFVGTLGNLAVIATVTVKHIRSRGRTNNDVGRAFIANLASSDLIVTSVINPLAITGTLIGEEELVNGRPWLCSAAASLCIISCVNSLLTIAIIAVNRYLYVCWTAAYDTVFTRRGTVVAVVLTWAAGVALDSPNHVGWSSHSFDAKTQKCLWDRTTAYHYTVFFVVVGMVLPFIVISICYWLIFAHIRLVKQRLLRAQCAAEAGYVATVKTIRQVKTVFVIFISFVSCWTPYVVVLLYDSSDSLPLPVHLFTSMLAHLHASLNFAIYSLSNRAYRAGYRRLATNLTTFCRRAAPRNAASPANGYSCHPVLRTATSGRVIGWRVKRTIVTVECFQMDELQG